MKTVRRSDKKQGRIAWKQSGDSLHHDVGKLVLFNPIPNAQQETSTRFQHAICFGEGPPFVGKKHHAKLTHHGVEQAVTKRQNLSICLSPGNPWEDHRLKAYSTMG